MSTGPCSRTLFSRPIPNNTLYDFVERYDDAKRQLIDEYKARKEGETQPWTVVPAGRVHKIWADFMKHGFIRDAKGIDKIAESVITNILRLQVNTELMGHTMLPPEEAANGELTAEEIENFVYYALDENGAWRISDYALDKLCDASMRLMDTEVLEEKLVLVDHVFNIAHCRSDLAANFIEGGSETLSRIFRPQAA